MSDPCPACTAALDQMHAEIEARARAAYARRDAELERFLDSQSDTTDGGTSCT